MIGLIHLERSNKPPFHHMLTLGREALGVRVTMGKLDRHGVFHQMRPCVFLLFRGRRLG
jgi:hypothetical protein